MLVCKGRRRSSHNSRAGGRCKAPDGRLHVPCMHNVQSHQDGIPVHKAVVAGECTQLLWQAQTTAQAAPHLRALLGRQSKGLAELQQRRLPPRRLLT